MSRSLHARAVLLALLLALVTVPARAENKPTPGHFTGFGFDQCHTPSQAAMDAWRDHSPFWGVGVYISGDSRACRHQPNLTPEWVATQLAAGWRLLPITLGPQASCNPRFPRYDDDVTIDPDPGRRSGYAKARAQGRASANEAVAVADSLGIVAGSTLWYDLEAFDIGNTRCRESALWFLHGWTYRLHAHDYVSGVYSSAGSGIKALDDARVDRPEVFLLPDRIWLAHWNGAADTTSPLIRADGWLPGNRMKQYQGGHDETWGGVRINIDRNYLDLGRGSVPFPERHCGGVPVDFADYRPLRPWVDDPDQVRALKCLLSEKGGYDGKVDGVFGPALLAAANEWKTTHGLPRSSRWAWRAWMTLLAAGPAPVQKVGSAGRAARRVQRALNASGIAELEVDGIYGSSTIAAVRLWQREAGLDVTGVVSADHWSALQSGTRDAASHHRRWLPG